MFPNNFLYISFYFLLSPLYCNSLLGSLNARVYLRSGGSADANNTMRLSTFVRCRSLTFHCSKNLARKLPTPPQASSLPFKSKTFLLHPEVQHLMARRWTRAPTVGRRTSWSLSSLPIKIMCVFRVQRLTIVNVADVTPNATHTDRLEVFLSLPCIVRVVHIGLNGRSCQDTNKALCARLALS